MSYGKKNTVQSNRCRFRPRYIYRCPPQSRWAWITKHVTFFWEWSSYQIHVINSFKATLLTAQLSRNANPVLFLIHFWLLISLSNMSGAHLLQSTKHNSTCQAEYINTLKSTLYMLYNILYFLLSLQCYTCTRIGIHTRTDSNLQCHWRPCE